MYFVGALFRAYQYEKSAMPQQLLLSLLEQLQNDERSSWTLYLIAREALYYGFHDIAKTILTNTNILVASEYNYHWMVHLQRWMIAEHNLVTLGRENSCDESIDDMIDSSLTTLRASLNALSSHSDSVSKKSHKRLNQEREEMAGSHANSGFQIDFLQWRQAFMFHIRNLMVILSTNKNKDRGTVHIMECANNFKSLADRMNYITYSHFGIDHSSFEQLSLFSMQCMIIVAAIERLIGVNYPLITVPDKGETEPPLGICCRQLKIQIESGENRDVTWLIDSVLKPLLCVPLQVPPLYFQVSRHTFVQLEIEVNKRHLSTSTVATQQQSGFTVGASVGQGLVMHFSGYIQLGEKSKRRVSAVGIRLDKRRLDEQETSAPEHQKIPIEVVEDSFQVESVIHFRKEGLYQVAVQLELVDQTHTSWHTKINQQMMVQVEPVKITSRLGAFT
jgi:hypothetical protein